MPHGALMPNATARLNQSSSRRFRRFILSGRLLLGGAAVHGVSSMRRKFRSEFFLIATYQEAQASTTGAPALRGPCLFGASYASNEVSPRTEGHTFRGSEAEAHDHSAARAAMDGIEGAATDRTSMDRSSQHALPRSAAADVICTQAATHLGGPS